MSRGVENDLAEVAKWIDHNELKLIAKKTNMLLLSRKRRAHDLDRVNVMLEDAEIQRSEKVKYLGVWIDEG